MFISSTEKKQMQTSILVLRKEVDEANAKISRLLKTVGSLIVRIETAVESVDQRKVRGWSMEQRNAQSERMKNAWAKKKEPKA
jgi:hypothetical protein